LQKVLSEIVHLQKQFEKDLDRSHSEAAVWKADIASQLERLSAAVEALACENRSLAGEVGALREAITGLRPIAAAPPPGASTMTDPPAEPEPLDAAAVVSAVVAAVAPAPEPLPEETAQAIAEFMIAAVPVAEEPDLMSHFSASSDEAKRDMVVPEAKEPIILHPRASEPNPMTIMGRVLAAARRKPSTYQDIARALRLRQEQVRPALSKLVSAGFLVCEDGVYAAPEPPRRRAA
jgi:hypothetical protein